MTVNGNHQFYVKDDSLEEIWNEKIWNMFPHEIQGFNGEWICIGVYTDAAAKTERKNE